MKNIFRWIVYAFFLILPLFLFNFVGRSADMMRWSTGSPLVFGYQWLRWNHVYFALGSLLCLSLYIPTILAIISRSLKPLLTTTVLIVVLIAGTIVTAIVGHNVYVGEETRNAEKTLAENPDDAMALERMANAYSQQGDFAKAIETFNKALSTTPNPAYVIHDRGIAYAGSGQLELAIADLTEAMKLKNDEKAFIAQCYNDRGVVYFRLGKYQQSWNDVSKAIELGYQYVNPDFLAALKEKGFGK